MRGRARPIAVTLFVATTVVVTTAAAGPAAVPRASTARPRASAVHVSRLPWRSSVARVVPNQVVVVWKDRASSAREQTITARAGGTGVPPTGGDVDVVRVPSQHSVGAAIHAFRRSPLVRFAEPNRIADPAGTPPPNDTFFGDQWALENTGQDHPLTAYPPTFNYGVIDHGTAGADVHAADAWTTQTGDASTVIAVLDTGVDITHPDLVNQVVPGWDFVGNDGDPTPGNGIENSHGTHVSGIVAAEQGNATGISGICPGCRVMPIRIGTQKGLTLANELKGIEFAIANGADIINMSFTSPVWSPAERAAIAKAGRHDILVVVAAGNSSMDNDIEFYDHLSDQVPSYAPAFPATYTLPNIISVAATNDRDQYAYVSQCRGSGFPLFTCGFTSFGHDSVDVAAPGVDIISTVKQGQGPGVDPDDDVWDGTSMAAPMVAGIAGLVRSQHPAWSAVQVKNAIMHSVQRPSSLKLYMEWASQTHVGKKLLSGKFTRTHGRVDAAGALVSATMNATPRTDGNIDGARKIKNRRTGSIGWPADDNDVFKRRLVQGKTYRIVLNGQKGKDLDLWVWRPKTKEIFQFTAACFTSPACPSFMAASTRPGTADESVRFKAPKTGTFYIQVNGWYSGGSYTLSVKAV